jgi:hypothetical protein
MLEAMIAAAPIKVRVRTHYVGDCHLLMTYGTGHPVRRPQWFRHLEKGGHCIGWDLGYWKHRDDGTCRMRVTIDQDHPQHWLRPESAVRWAAEGIPLRSDGCQTGPIILVGMGAKSAKVYAGGALVWERRALEQLRAELPGRAIVYRPKRVADPCLPGIGVVRGPIESALAGASLVVCRHSNVAVDACIAGVPVRCEDGAAAALYSQSPSPTPVQRLKFLQSLAYWQWTPEEARDAWQYLLMRLSA